MAAGWITEETRALVSVPLPITKAGLTHLCFSSVRITTANVDTGWCAFKTHWPAVNEHRVPCALKCIQCRQGLRAYGWSTHSEGTKKMSCVKLMCQYPLERINKGDFSILAQGNTPPVSNVYFACTSLLHNLSGHQQSHSCFAALAPEKKRRCVHVTWPHPQFVFAELEINETQWVWYMYARVQETQRPLYMAIGGPDIQEWETMFSLREDFCKPLYPVKSRFWMTLDLCSDLNPIKKYVPI